MSVSHKTTHNFLIHVTLSRDMRLYITKNIHVDGLIHVNVFLSERSSSASARNWSRGWDVLLATCSNIHLIVCKSKIYLKENIQHLFSLNRLIKWHKLADFQRQIDTIFVLGSLTDGHLLTGLRVDSLIFLLF